MMRSLSIWLSLHGGHQRGVESSGKPVGKESGSVSCFDELSTSRLCSFCLQAPRQKRNR